MTVEENKKLVKMSMEAFNMRDLAEKDRLVDEIFAPDYIVHDPGWPDFGIGPEAVKHFMHAAIENSPDIHVVLQDMLAEGDKVTSRFTVHATNPSTGKPEVTEVMCISRISGGKIVEEWQLGVEITQPVEV